MADLESYYNKFNENKRLLSRHGQVEYFVTNKYIHDYLFKGAKIADIGAGTGAYSIALAKEGYDVTAVEYCKCNLGVLKANVKKENVNVKSFLGDCTSLHMLQDNTFDITLVFGPLYHLHGEEKQLKALEEARRITKEGGVILVAYYMNDYCVVSYGFKDNHIKESLEKGKLNKDFICTHNEDDLYEPVTVSYINYLLSKTKLKRIKLVGVDGPTDYMRQVINAMDEDTFSLFKQYCLSISEKQEMIGACSHTLDILKK